MIAGKLTLLTRKTLIKRFSYIFLIKKDFSDPEGKNMNAT